MSYLFNISYPVFYVFKRSLIGDVIYQHNSLFIPADNISNKNCWKDTVIIMSDKNSILPMVDVTSLQFQIMPILLTVYPLFSVILIHSPNHNSTWMSITYFNASACIWCINIKTTRPSPFAFLINKSSLHFTVNNSIKCEESLHQLWHHKDKQP